MNKTNNTTKQNCKNTTELNFKGEKNTSKRKFESVIILNKVQNVINTKVKTKAYK